MYIASVQVNCQAVRNTEQRQVKKAKGGEMQLSRHFFLFLFGKRVSHNFLSPPPYKVDRSTPALHFHERAIVASSMKCFNGPATNQQIKISILA